MQKLIDFLGQFKTPDGKWLLVRDQPEIILELSEALNDALKQIATVFKTEKATHVYTTVDAVTVFVANLFIYQETTTTDDKLAINYVTHRINIAFDRLLETYAELNAQID